MNLNLCFIIRILVAPHTFVWFKFAMNLKQLSNENLLSSIRCLVQKERELTLEVLHHLREVERRSLYATLSYSSLYEYAIKELKYSEAAAHRRISSMRLLREMPELEEKIESGKLSLSAISQAQSFFRQEKCVLAEKKEILKCIEEKSAREVERELVSRSSEPLKLRPEKLRVVSETHTELKILVEAELLNGLEELRGLLAHKKPGATLKDLLTYAVTRTVNELKPKVADCENRKSESQAPKNPELNRQDIMTPASEAKPRSRYVSKEIKRKVWQRDGGQCSYKNTATGRRCCSKHAMEFDHIKPFALGGESTFDNLRLRCRTHNQLEALKVFGQVKMSSYMTRLG